LSRIKFVAGPARKAGTMPDTNVGPPLDVSAAKLAVTEARKAYEAAVAQYRAAVKVTDQEFENAEENLSERIEHSQQDRSRPHEEYDRTDAMDYEESVLDYIVEHLDDIVADRDDEEERGAKAAGT
jgi:hypothetical protein